MNFSCFILFLLLVSCGVKGPPLAPKGSSIPSIEEDHPDLKLKPGTMYPVKAP